MLTTAELEEFARFKFRVRVPGRGPMHFEQYGDAHGYMKACLYAECIDLFVGDRWINGWCEDGDIVFNRPGFGVLTKHRRRS